MSLTASKQVTVNLSSAITLQTL